MKFDEWYEQQKKAHSVVAGVESLYFGAYEEHFKQQLKSALESAFNEGYYEATLTMSILHHR